MTTLIFEVHLDYSNIIKMYTYINSKMLKTYTQIYNKTMNMDIQTWQEAGFGKSIEIICEKPLCSGSALEY